MRCKTMGSPPILVVYKDMVLFKVNVADALGRSGDEKHSLPPSLPSFFFLFFIASKN